MGQVVSVLSKYHQHEQHPSRKWGWALGLVKRLLFNLGIFGGIVFGKLGLF
ncbi:hypothetical protein SDC9_06671 [bioreactor metagenome]|jgi:hypothetical protein|uniref:Uncharacterized protein n=1 Tax=bioreactor metagenome TaxID=1076179 RepID=A0A644T2P9_9ZZZZ